VITMAHLILLCFSLIFIITLPLCTSQSVALRSVAVKGTLLCGNSTAKGAKVRLYRVASNDVNEVLDTRDVSPLGMFEVNANTNGRPVNQTDLVPVIKVYHKCGDDAKQTGYRRFQIGVPREFVGLGRIAKNTFDVGKLNLQVTYPGEAREKEL